MTPSHLGASTITTCRPSKRGSCSTLAILRGVVLDAVEQLVAELLVRHLAAAEAQA